MAPKYDVTGDPRYIADIHQAEGQLLELFRQLRDKKGYQGDLETLRQHLQDAVEQDFRGSYLDPYHFSVQVDYKSSLEELIKKSGCYVWEGENFTGVPVSRDKFFVREGENSSLGLIFPEKPLVEFVEEMNDSGFLPGTVSELLAISKITNRIAGEHRRFPIYAPGSRIPPRKFIEQGGFELPMLTGENKLQMTRFYPDSRIYDNDPKRFEGQVALLVAFPRGYPRIR